MINRKWTLVSRPSGPAKPTDFALVEETVPSLKDGEFLVRNVYLGLEPAYRNWLDAQPDYLPPQPLDTVVRGIGLGIVEQSNHTDFPVGARVSGLMGWQTHLVTDGITEFGPLQVLPDLPLPLSTFLSVLSIHGATAYVGMMEIAKVASGEVVVVTGAAGAVGSLAGQIAKINGATVIGIAGSDEKIAWLTNELGFDYGINYKTEDVALKLRELAPEGVDAVFENVGGEVFDAVTLAMKPHGRIAVCGWIASYNACDDYRGPKNITHVIFKRLKIEGFMIFDHAEQMSAILEKLAGWVGDGRLKHRIHEIDGIENAVDAYGRLFTGDHKGKLMVKISSP